MSIVIVTDSCCDLPLEFIEKSGIRTLGLTCHFNGRDYEDDFGKTLGYKEFYDFVRNGEMPSTSQINVQRFLEEFKRHVNEGNSVIYIGFSSALSGTVGSAAVAREQILEENSRADISVIDSKCASLGQGLLVYHAWEMLNQGFSKDEITAWAEDNKLRINHWFTVEDLHHLKRGGRISASTAIIGSMLEIKPIMHVDDEGRLIPVDKVMGRKKSLKTLAKTLKERIVDPEEQVIAISHGDCIGDVEYLKNLIMEECRVKDIIVNNVGPVIGSHSGPGTVALFFMGEKR